MTSGHAAAGRQVRSETGLPLPVPAADPHHRHLQVTRHVPRGQECNTVVSNTCPVSRWDASSAGPPAPVSALDPRSELVSVALSASVTAAVESSGQVLELETKVREDFTSTEKALTRAFS